MQVVRALLYKTRRIGHRRLDIGTLRLRHRVEHVDVLVDGVREPEIDLDKVLVYKRKL